jgi:hypothetical protein
VRSFALWGDVRDGFVLLNARNVEGQALGVVTWLLEVAADGRTMKGLGLWRSATKGVIESDEFMWTRESTGATR